MHKSCSKMLEQQQNIFAGQAINCRIRRCPKYTLMETARGHVFFQVSHHALGHKENKDNMAGGGTKLKASTLHPSLFDKDW